MSEIDVIFVKRGSSKVIGDASISYVQFEKLMKTLKRMERENKGKKHDEAENNS